MHDKLNPHVSLASLVAPKYLADTGSSPFWMTLNVVLNTYLCEIAYTSTKVFSQMKNILEENLSMVS